MKRNAFSIFVVALLLTQVIGVGALSASDAKQDWRDAKQASKEAQEAHREAKLDWAADKTPENEENLIETGKDSMHAALDEAEAWLIWAKLEAQENPEVPDDLKDAIEGDVEDNLDKIDELRDDVDGIDNQLEMGLVFLKMVGKYFELLADVGRNVGMVWSHIAELRIDDVEDYESELRDIAEGMEDNDEILDKLDNARDELEEAEENVEEAEEAYEEVRLPGTPLIKFAEGNSHLRAARANLLSAHSYLNQAFRLIT